MSRAALINAFNALAEAAASVAIELEASDSARSGAVPDSIPAAAAGVAPPSAPAAPSVIDQGECPKHHKPWKIGTYGPYCTSTTDDPAWGKQKPDGKMFCKITPENAPQWLRIHGAA